jgi:hypothetical protein
MGIFCVGTDTKNRIYIWCRTSEATDIKNTHFLCRLFKTTNKKNKSLFFVTVGIISHHHKKILHVTINHFSSSDNWRANESRHLPSRILRNFFSALFSVSHARASPSFPLSPYIMPDLDERVEEHTCSGGRAEVEEDERGAREEGRVEPNLKTVSKGNGRRPEAARVARKRYKGLLNVRAKACITGGGTFCDRAGGP